MPLCTLGGCRGTAETQTVPCNSALVVLADASAKYPTKEAKMRILANKQQETDAGTLMGNQKIGEKDSKRERKRETERSVK